MASDGSDDIHGVRGSGKDQTKSLLGSRLDTTELFSLLESRDSRILEEVKSLVHENLHTAREPWFLCALVEYYLTTKSSRCLDILTSIREPHDKFLFDKLLECLKSQQWREDGLFLLSHVVRKQPSWLHRISGHKVLTYLLQLLKTDINIPHLMSGLLTVVTLLPIIPSLAGPHLPDVFEVFARLAAWNTKKTGNVPEVYFLHLRVALYHLFSRLYAMYPCNFLAFLRSHYGCRENSRESRENLHVFSETIKPMLERVRLHPLLVTFSKDMELSVSRWKNMEPHDIIVQCSKVSLDTVESIHNDADQKDGPTEHTRKHWSLTEAIKINLPIEPGSLVGEALDQLTRSQMPCPLKICDFSPTNDIQELQEDDHLEGLNSLVTSVTSVTSKAEYEMDFELPDAKAQHDEVDGSSISTCKGATDLSKTESLGGISRSSEGEVVTAEEAREESQKHEVSQSSAAHQAKQVPQQGQKVDPTSGHFVSTTDTLTTTMTFTDVDEAANNNGSLSSSSMQEEEMGNVSLASLGGASNVLLERLVHGINRLRFFSHCGHPPEIPLEWIRRSPTLHKSHSWPILKSESFSISPHETTHPIGSPVYTPAAASNNVVAAAAVPNVPAETPVINQPKESSPEGDKSKQQEHLETPAVTSKASSPIPSLAKETSSATAGARGSREMEPTLAAPTFPHFSYPSPSELLDTYLHLGSQVYLQGLSLTSGKDINWTHFGGPAPADELSILRGQITLLHTQLLFERYRREVHAERNRRLLGKDKKARALEEQNMAYREQLALQEKEIHDLNNRLLQIEVKGHGACPCTSTRDLHDHLRLLRQDNQKLDTELQKARFTVDQQDKEIATLRKTLDETQCHLLESSHELEAVRRQASRCTELQRDVKHLTAELAVAYDLHQRYVDKVEHEAKPTDLNFHLSHLKESATHEIEDLKRQCRNQSNEIEALKMKTEMLEQAIVNKDLVVEQLKQLLESVKSSHKDIVEAKANRILSLQNICQRQEEHILELKSRICIQDTHSKPDTFNFHRMESIGNVQTPWHPAQQEPTSGINKSVLDAETVAARNQESSNLPS